MLKRQRPQSPFQSVPFTLDHFPSTEPSLDLCERLTKRRRYFKSAHNGDDDDGGEKESHSESVENGQQEVPDSREPDYYGGLRRPWQDQAGVYKDANSLLHDLHAEQRHRMIFASPLSSPSLHCTSSPQSPHSDYTFPRQHEAPQPPSPSLHHASASKFATSNYGRNDEAESHVVACRYEETNRLLGSVFLNRRRMLDAQTS